MTPTREVAQAAKVAAEALDKAADALTLAASAYARWVDWVIYRGEADWHEEGKDA